MARNKTTIGEKYNAPFPTQLRNLMDTKGKTQEGLAKAVGKTRQTVSQYVNGISEPGYDTLVKIADYFDVSIDYLLGRTQDPARLPCASDELGLSAQSINWLSLLASSPDRSRYTKYLSALFEMENFQGLVHLLIDYFSALKAQSIAGSILNDSPPDKYFEHLEEASKDPQYDGMTQLYLEAFAGFEHAFFNPGAAMLLDEDDDVIHVLDILELKIKRNVDSLLRTMEDCYE